MQEQTIIRTAKVTVAVLAAFTLFWGSFYTVDEGERGVQLRNGAIVGTAEPGLGFKVPLIDDVKFITVQTQARQYVDLLAYSRDQQTASLAISVNYRLPPDQMERIYTEYGGEEGIVSRLLDRQVAEKVKTVFGQFNAVLAIQDRARLNAEVQSAVQKSVVGPIIIESVQIENIDFSDVYENSIEQRMLAEVEVQKLQQNAQREKVQAEITVTQAKATADATVATAEAAAKSSRLAGEAAADVTRLTGEAEADAIRAKSAALADNPALIELVQAEKWDGVLPTTMVPGGAVPFLNVKP